jgi:hypothetical protein
MVPGTRTGTWYGIYQVPVGTGRYRYLYCSEEADDSMVNGLRTPGTSRLV